MADRVLTDTTNSPLKKRGAGEAGATQKLAQKKQKTQKGGKGVLQSLLESILYTSTNGMKWRQVPRHDHGHQSLARRQNGRDSKLLCLKGMVELLLAGSAHSFAKNVTKQTMQGFHLSLSKCVIAGLDSSKSPRVDGVSRYANTFYVDPGNPLYTALAVIVGDDSFTIPRGGKVQRISAIRSDGKCTVQLKAAPYTEGVVLHSALGVEVETNATRRFKVDAPARARVPHRVATPCSAALPPCPATADVPRHRAAVLRACVTCGALHLARAPPRSCPRSACPCSARSHAILSSAWRCCRSRGAATQTPSCCTASERRCCSTRSSAPTRPSPARARPALPPRHSSMPSLPLPLLTAPRRRHSTRPRHCL